MTGYGCHRVRWSKADGEFQVQCDTCLDFLPLTIEFWVPKHGLTHCRACYRDVNNVNQRERNRVRRSDPSYRASEVAGHRAVRRANRDAALEARREWYRRNAERMRAQRRALYAASKVEKNGAHIAVSSEHKIGGKATSQAQDSWIVRRESPLTLTGSTPQFGGIS